MKRNKKTINQTTLEKWGACSSGVEFWRNTLNKERSVIKCIQYCIDNQTHLNDANWLIVRCLSKKNAQRYAVYAAEQVLEIFEKEYPNDDRPRKVIEAAKAVIERDTEANRFSAYAAARAADAADAARAAYSAARAADAAFAAYAAARAADAAFAAYAAARAADAAADAAFAAYAAARAADAADAARAAYSAAHAVYAAREEMQIKILAYGLELLNS